jgi:hypothetical protein
VGVGCIFLIIEKNYQKFVSPIGNVLPSSIEIFQKKAAAALTCFILKKFYVPIIFCQKTRTQVKTHKISASQTSNKIMISKYWNT